MKNHKKLHYILISFCFIIYLLLSVYNIDGIGLWLDEIMSLDFCDSTFKEMIRDISEDVHAPLYYIFLHFFIKSMGISEFTSRLPGIIFGILTIVGLYFLAKKIINKEYAVLSCFLLSISPFFIEFSREVHPYSLSALLSVMSWLFLIKYLYEKKTKYIYIYGIFCGLLLLTFYLGIIIIFSQIIFIYFMKISKKRKINILKGLFVCILIFLIWIKQFYYQIKADEIGVIENYFPNGIGFFDILNNLGDIFLGTSLRKFGIFVLIVNIILAFYILSGKKRKPVREIFADNLILFMFWSSFIIFTIICLIKPIYLSRYAVLSAPFAVLILSRYLYEFKSSIKGLILFIIVFIFVLGYRGYILNVPKEDWKGTSEFIISDIKPLDVIVCDSTNAQSCLNYYFFMNKRKDLMKANFDIKMFFELTGGKFNFNDRHLYLLISKTNKINNEINILNGKNKFLSEHYFKKGFSIRVYTGI
ncbi:glycosyltransferase family 39 protein [Candidatus Gracilibacteria bacterium]|nr:glycosyltransferase family 39 protein [Candidatus Gracilibacteria bacterium]